jgi:hypothetical protein
MNAASSSHSPAERLHMTLNLAHKPGAQLGAQVSDPAQDTGMIGSLISRPGLFSDITISTPLTHRKQLRSRDA